MSGLIPLDECIARPDSEDGRHGLKEHLHAVKEAMEHRLGGANGLFKDDPLTIRLAGLAGLCHDIAKAHRGWQDYIRGKSRKGPNHSPEGAFLFSYLGYHLLKKANGWSTHAVYWLWMVQDIADHHGSLKNLRSKNWIHAAHWEEMDLQGISAFIWEVFSELSHIPITVEALDQWLDQIDEVLEEAYDKLDLGYSFEQYETMMEKLCFWRELTTALIAGDRFHVTPLEMACFNKGDHIQQDKNLDDYCKDNNDKEMAEIRKRAQKQILSQLMDMFDCSEGQENRIYSMEMPTGYGKTIAALKVTTLFERELGSAKVIYVAPYLSILEQTSSVIEKAMGVSVLEHHSLAILPEEKHEKDGEEDETLSVGQLMMEAWDNPVVCTSFQQWSKALFPGRAQDTLRRAFLKNSVVIIDEPQIFAPESWNVFLSGLEAAAKIYNLRIFFLSATMPPFEYGLSKPPVFLTIKPEKHVERYRVELKGEMDERAVAEYLLNKAPNREKEGFSQAVILNTITDAYLVYKQLLDLEISSSNLMLLNGLMAPLHKRVVIEKIKKFQKDHKKERLYVVSTQILEAGVDLSFDHIMRALAILPSIVQAGGRVNRHSTELLGTLTLMLFLRGGKKDTRSPIYEPSLQKLTDKLLQQNDTWVESEMLELIKDYYKKMFACNSYEAGKEAIKEAYQGDWPKLGQFKPFSDNDYNKLPVFVPWQATEEDKELFPERFQYLQKHLELYSPESIYERYEDRNSYSQLSIQERKKLMILMNHYIVNVPTRLALSLVDKDIYLKNRIPILLNKSEYDPATGLAKRAIEGFDSII